MKKMPLLLYPGFFFLLFFAAPLWAGEAGNPGGKISAGSAFTVPVIIDRVTGLAGAKLMIRYDAAALEFDKCVRTPATSSLMHVANDDPPGRIVLVMAGGQGISGDNLVLVNLHFTAKNRIASENLKFVISGVQLLDENLRRIRAKIRVGDISLVASESSGCQAVQPGPPEKKP